MFQAALLSFACAGAGDAQQMREVECVLPGGMPFYVKIEI